MSATVTVAPESTYVIPADNTEKRRLGDQYLWKKTAWGWTGAVPPSVDVSEFTHVLDVAAGTCYWTQDFASMPQVQPRLITAGQSPEQPALQLYACDIDPRFFPEKSVLDPLGVITFQQDVTKPFPQDMHGKFDLVHISMLFLCLTEDMWRDAMRNCHEVLKPGGLMMVEEADPVLYYPDESGPNESGPGHDLEARLNKPGWLGKANSIYTRFGLEHGYPVDLTFRLPELMSSTGYEIFDNKRARGPWGRFCRECKGVTGADLSEYVDFTLDNMRHIYKHLAMALLAKGKLVEPSGTQITTEEGVAAMLQEVEGGMREEGAFLVAGCCIGKKTA